MKKIILFLILTLLMLNFNFLCVACNESEKQIGEIKEDLFSILSDDVKETLKSIGIEENSFESLYKVSLDNISSYFKNTLKETVNNVSSEVATLFSLVIIIGFIAILIKDCNADYFEQLCTVVVSLYSVSIATISLGSVITVLKLSSGFMISYIPIYTLVISLSGNAATAFTYNSLVLFFAEAVSTVISSAMTDFMGIFFCFSIAFSMNSAINTSRFISSVNKIVTFVLGFLSSAFASFLSIRSVLSSSVDSVSARSIKFMISSFIPVVGSSISDAYSSIIGSINLIKGSVAVVGILAVIIINLPVIIETLIYYLSFSVLSNISDGFICKGTGNVLKGFASGIRILLLLCVFQMFVLVISTGIMLSFKGGN